MVMALDKMPALSDYGAIIAQFLPFVVLIVVFYFFLIRPRPVHAAQRRKMRRRAQIKQGKAWSAPRFDKIMLFYAANNLSSTNKEAVPHNTARAIYE